MNKNKYPNAAVISIITEDIGGSSKNERKVLFFTVRPVASHLPNGNLYWYPGAGKDGQAKILWLHNNLRHYFAVGTRQAIDLTLSAFLHGDPIQMGLHQQLFSIPDHFTKEQNPDYTWGIHANHSTEFVLARPMEHIPSTFLVASQLNILTGWQSAQGGMECISPSGFYGKNELFNLLQDNIFGVVEHVTPKVHSYGSQKTAVKGEGVLDFYGFYQNYDDKLQSLTMELQTTEGKTIAETPVTTNGLFNFHVNAPLSSGMLVSKPKEGRGQCIVFSLIQNFNVNAHIVSKIYSDPYGQKWNLTETSGERPPTLTPYTWQIENYALAAEAEKVLSNKFGKVFACLGPNVLIADPYFCGPVTKDNLYRNKALAHCQRAFFNAIYFAKTIFGLDSIIIMGNKDKIKDVPVVLSDEAIGVKSDYIENCKDLVNRFLHANFNDLKVQFFHASRFHNRYWFGLRLEHGSWIIEKCIIITNSLGNIQEVDIIPVSDPAQLSVIGSRYTKLFKFAELL